MAETRIPTEGDFSNPFLVCIECSARVRYIDTEGNQPCGHRADTASVCETWTPVDGCRCVALTGFRIHGVPT